MTEFALHEVKEVRELEDSDAVNAHLKDGWILLSQGTGRHPQGFPVALYVVGWTKAEKPKLESQLHR